jgi:hypothetical protein
MSRPLLFQIRSDFGKLSEGAWRSWDYQLVSFSEFQLSDFQRFRVSRE